MACLEPCLAPYDPSTLNRRDIPANVQQLMIVQDTQVFVQGQRYQGEVLMNCVALSASVDGPIIFIFKLQDLHAMSQQQADLIASLIVTVERHLPKVVRGQQARELNGYMKCALDRHSCCGGDFGKTKAGHPCIRVATRDWLASTNWRSSSIMIRFLRTTYKSSSSFKDLMCFSACTVSPNSRMGCSADRVACAAAFCRISVTRVSSPPNARTTIPVA